MRYWWVNQKQTYRHEVPGVYLWSPKRNANGHTNPFYEYMREVAPGDIVFSFADGHIKALGIVASHGYEAPKSCGFGQVGAYWDRGGWRVDVAFREFYHRLKPSDHMEIETERSLFRRNALFVKQPRTADESAELSRLSDELADLVFSTSDFRDPDDALFVRKMAQHGRFRKPTLTPEEQAEQYRLADKIIEEILREDAGQVLTPATIAAADNRDELQRASLRGQASQNVDEPSGTAGR